jgi:hypothetical protein
MAEQVSARQPLARMAATAEPEAVAELLATAVLAEPEAMEPRARMDLEG